MNETLFKQVRRKLNITWEDETTNARVTDIINAAIPILSHKLGITDPNMDFSISGAENMLFLAYCLYEWNHSVAEFDMNYSNEIAQIRAKYAVAAYEAEVEDDE